MNQDQIKDLNKTLEELVQEKDALAKKPNPTIGDFEMYDMLKERCRQLAGTILSL